VVGAARDVSTPFEGRHGGISAASRRTNWSRFWCSQPSMPALRRATHRRCRSGGDDL